jgi:cell division protein DivIC
MVRKMKFPKWAKNKYVLATGAFLLWICFLNDIDLFYILKSRSELNSLKREVRELKEKNEKAVIALEELSTNSRTMEKFARETYYMKRDNEEVFVFKERSK